MAEQETPLLIAVAPNGARRMKADHPALPIAPAEIAEEARRCHAAGARMLHLHVRDDEGAHSLAPELYREAMAAVRAQMGDDMVIQVTTEAAGIYGPREQMAVIRDLKPEAASFALRELVPDAASEPAAQEFFAGVGDQGIAAQYILYEPEEVPRFLDLIERSVLPAGPAHALFVLGRSDRDAEPVDLLEFLRRWPAPWPWSVCAFGPVERRVAALAAALGGHVRVGFENNLWTPDGGQLVTTAEQVAAVRRIAADLGRPLADIDQAKRLLGLLA